MIATHDMPADSVRGRIYNYLHANRGLLGTKVLEVGSRMHTPDAWWLNNRRLLPSSDWTGLDMQEGENVDIVADIHSLPDSMHSQYTGILCSEVLEHVARPWVALPQMYACLQPGGWIVITTLLTFHIHGYPDDYYRYTESGLKLLLGDAGFVDISTEYGGDTVLVLKNHDEMVFHKRVPLQIFARARKP